MPILKKKNKCHISLNKCNPYKQLFCKNRHLLKNVIVFLTYAMIRKTVSLEEISRGNDMDYTKPSFDYYEDNSNPSNKKTDSDWTSWQNRVDFGRDKIKEYCYVAIL